MKGCEPVITNVPSLNPGGPGMVAAIDDGVAIDASNRICLLEALMFQFGACCTAGKAGSADPALNNPVSVPPFAIPA